MGRTLPTRKAATRMHQVMLMNLPIHLIRSSKSIRDASQLAFLVMVGAPMDDVNVAMAGKEFHVLSRHAPQAANPGREGASLAHVIASVVSLGSTAQLQRPHEIPRMLVKQGHYQMTRNRSRSAQQLISMSVRDMAPVRATRNACASQVITQTIVARIRHPRWHLHLLLGHQNQEEALRPPSAAEVNR